MEENVCLTARNASIGKICWPVCGSAQSDRISPFQVPSKLGMPTNQGCRKGQRQIHRSKAPIINTTVPRTVDAGRKNPSGREAPCSTSSSAQRVAAIQNTIGKYVRGIIRASLEPDVVPCCVQKVVGLFACPWLTGSEQVLQFIDLAPFVTIAFGKGCVEGVSEDIPNVGPI